MLAGGSREALVIGAGPNGLAAAIVLAQAGVRVTVYEAADRAGGGLRSAALTLPGFTHDVCATVHALGVSSPLFRDLPLQQHGLEWIAPPAPLAHPLDDGTAVMLERCVEATAQGLGPDRRAYERLMRPLVSRAQPLLDELLAFWHWPRHPLLLARFGVAAARSAMTLARQAFQGPRAQALFAGLAAHSVLPLDQLPSSAFGLVLGIAAHAGGWPFARGGSQRLADALVAHLRSLGGELVTGARIESLKQLPSADALLCDLAPRHLARLAADRLPASYRDRLSRYRYGPGVFKMDWALSGPIPWTAAECGRAGTVHLGGTLEEIAQSERDAWQGRLSARPFVLLTQPSLFDPTRSPPGSHTAWAYCHVPNGSTADMTDAIEAQIERFAPGFRSGILARHARTTRDLERENPNCVGGDVTGGAQNLGQLLARPVASFVPHLTPANGLYLCSASTPPGGGVHGMCGYHAARAALRRSFGKRTAPV
jgi:phytoene dehydrogenase-like protein